MPAAASIERHCSSSVMSSPSCCLSKPFLLKTFRGHNLGKTASQMRSARVQTWIDRLIWTALGPGPPRDKSCHITLTQHVS